MRRPGDEIDATVAQSFTGLVVREDQLVRSCQSFFGEVAERDGGNRRKIRVGDEVGDRNFDGGHEPFPTNPGA